MKRRAPAEVEQDIDALREMSIKALRERWREVLKTEPPPKMQSGFLRLAIAYRLQELALGGLKPDALRQLRKYAKSIEARSSAAVEGPMPSKVVSFGTGQLSELLQASPWKLPMLAPPNSSSLRPPRETQCSRPK